MKLIEKTLALLLIAVMTLTLITGCGNESSKVSETVRWINATYAIITEINGDNHNLFGGMKPGEDAKQAVQTALKDYWGVTDRESADDTMDWLLNEGHRTEYAELMSVLKEYGAAEETKEDLEKILGELEEDVNAGPYLAQSFYDYMEFGPTAIDAWDYSRAVSLLGWYYLAGYYTETEALDKALEVAQTVQKKFSSWDDFTKSYFRGYTYWSKSDYSDRLAIYEKLKEQKDGPYQVPWDLTLEKTWEN